MEKQLKILITNDDGIESSGLRRLAEAAIQNHNTKPSLFAKSKHVPLPSFPVNWLQC